MDFFFTITWPLWLFLGAYLIYFYLRYGKSKYGEASGVSMGRLLRDKGALGEFYTFEDLERLPGHHHILTNVYLPKAKGGTTEADLVFLCEFGVFVIESKNYGGWIYGNEKEKYWTQTFPNSHKDKFYNPIWQNDGHISALKNVTGLDKACFHSIIVFSNRCELKTIHLESDQICVIQRNQLYQTILEEFRKRDVCLTAKEVDVLYYRKLIPYIHADQKTKDDHIRHLQG
jgi:hypothetical protein